MQTTSYTYTRSFAPGNIPTDATSVTFSSFPDVTISPLTFVRLTECSSIVFTRFSYSYHVAMVIQENAWYGLDKLTNLVIEQTTLAQLTKDIFKHLRNLRTLNLRGNRIHTISDGAFYTLNSLKYLSLEQSSIVIVGVNVWHDVSRLIDLSFYINSMQVLKNKSFEHQSALQTLNLAYNRISSVETEAFYGLVSLRKLFLNNNFITFKNTTASEVWRDLSLLEELYLQQNKIGVLQSKFFKDLISLQKLDISQNNIMLVNADTFYKLENLTDLDISENSISVIEAGAFNGLRSLIELNIVQNPITVSEGNFQGLKAIKDLDLSRADIVKITAGILQGLSSLQKLVITDTNLESMESKSFQDMNSTLVQLDVSNNELTTLQEETFYYLILLEELLLYNNKISNIAPRTFTGLQSLRSLQLQEYILETFIQEERFCIFDVYFEW